MDLVTAGKHGYMGSHPGSGSFICHFLFKNTSQRQKTLNKYRTIIRRLDYFRSMARTLELLAEYF